MVERGLLALKTGDPDECGWPNEPGLCMGLAGMGEVFVRAQRHETHFSKTETRKATGLKTGIHWIVNTYLCTCFFFFSFCIGSHSVALGGLELVVPGCLRTQRPAHFCLPHWTMLEFVCCVYR